MKKTLASDFLWALKAGACCVAVVVAILIVALSPHHPPLTDAQRIERMGVTPAEIAQSRAEEHYTECLKEVRANGPSIWYLKNCQ